MPEEQEVSDDEYLVGKEFSWLGMILAEVPYQILLYPDGVDSISSVRASEFGDLVSPWSTEPLSDDAPEDCFAPDPCSFSQPLRYMNMPYEQALSEFIDALP